jgi:hypothetical protein
VLERFYRYRAVITLLGEPFQQAPAIGQSGFTRQGTFLIEHPETIRVGRVGHVHPHHRIDPPDKPRLYSLPGCKQVEGIDQHPDVWVLGPQFT